MLEQFDDLEKKIDRDNVITRFLLGVSILNYIDSLPSSEKQTWLLRQSEIKTNLKLIAKRTIDLFYRAHQYSHKPLENQCNKDDFFKLIIGTPESAAIFCRLDAPSDMHVFFNLHMGIENNNQANFSRYNRLLKITPAELIALEEYHYRATEQATTELSENKLSLEQGLLFRNALTKFNEITQEKIRNQRYSQALVANTYLMDTDYFKKFIFFMVLTFITAFVELSIPSRPIIALLGIMQFRSYFSSEKHSELSARIKPSALALAHFKQHALQQFNGEADVALTVLELDLIVYQNSVALIQNRKTALTILAMLFFVGCAYKSEDILKSCVGLLLFGVLGFLQRMSLVFINAQDGSSLVKQGLFIPKVVEDRTADSEMVRSPAIHT